ncbi:hypothetical protein D3C87_1905530 [compost metagenome]
MEAAQQIVVTVIGLVVERHSFLQKRGQIALRKRLRYSSAQDLFNHANEISAITVSQVKKALSGLLGQRQRFANMRFSPRQQT